MARVRSEDQIFFLFNHDALTCEADDLKDAIVYFFPSSISTDRQCALTGQLMGMVQFFKSFAGSPPAIFTLQHNRIAVKHLGKYTMALAGNRGEPDGVVLAQLDYLYKLLVFYQCSFDKVEKASQGSSSKMSLLMQDIWDSYLPFIRRYGDNIAAAFESLPVIDLQEPKSMVFLKATHIIQRCQRQHNALAGCILYRNRVVCTQFHPVITARLLIIQPQQSHFPCQCIKTDFKPQPAVKLLNIFLTKDECKYIESLHAQLGPFDANPVRQTPPKAQSNITQQHTMSSTKTKEKSRKHVPTHSRQFGSVDWNNTVKEFRTLVKDTAALTIKKQFVVDEDDHSKKESKSTSKLSYDVKSGKEMVPASPLHKSSSQPDMSSESSETKPRSNTVASGTIYRRQRSHEFKASNIVAVEHGEEVTEMLNQSRQNDSRMDLVDEVVSEASPSRVHQPRSHSNTMSLLQNIKKITAQSRGILEEMTRQADLSADMIDRDSGREYRTRDPIQECNQPSRSDGKKQNYGTQGLNSSQQSFSSPRYYAMVNETKSPVGDETVKACEKRHSSTETSNINSNYDKSNQSMTATETTDRDVAQQGQMPHQDEPECVFSDYAKDSDGTQTAIQDLNSAMNEFSSEQLQDAAENGTKDQDLAMFDLYTQGCSDSVLMLLMSRDTLKNADNVKNLNSSVSSHLTDLDSQLSQLSNEAAMKQDVPLDYNYLTYDSYTKNLSGKISMARGTIQPMSHQELDFCGTAIGMHCQFEKSPGLLDMTLRNHSTCVFGHRAFSQEMYFQPKQCKPPNGIPSARDPTMCLDARACQTILKDQGVHII